MASKEIICLECPTACHLEITLDASGRILECTGGQCKRALTYAQQELREPVRVLTTTVLTEGSRTPLLAVRTDRPVPKDRLKEGVNSLACLRVKPPICAGQVLVADLASTGASVIACDDLSE